MPRRTALSSIGLLPGIAVRGDLGWDGGCASFETPVSRSPQDEEHFEFHLIPLMLRSTQRVRLEARTASAERPASVSHHRPVLFPEAADRSLAGAERLRLSIITAHHDDACIVVVVAQRALHKSADAAIFHRDVAG